jgi:putative acetyltransferase
VRISLGRQIAEQESSVAAAKIIQCNSPKMEIRIDDLRGPEIAELLADHLQEFAPLAPPESRHALDLNGLRQPEITFWTVWDDRQLAGCGALKQLDAMHGEIKSMRTAKTHLRRGVASQLLAHIIAEARCRGYRRLSLETGSMAYFKPAQALYAKFGFEYCPPFGSYRLDPNSVFMTQEL